VDISYTKDFADFNHTNFVAPATNQLYIGWTADGEWCNYTVDVKQPGAYRVIALYGNAANTIRFSINHQPVGECKLPLATGSMHIPESRITVAHLPLQQWQQFRVFRV
jgi:hypothetical protein